MDVRRVYRIIALRRLGIGLDEIAGGLDSDEVSLVETVPRHLGQVERELEHQQLLRERLCRTWRRSNSVSNPPWMNSSTRWRR